MTLGRPECVTVLEFALFLALIVATHVLAFLIGGSAGYMRGRRDERREWQPPTPKKEIH